MEGSKDKRRKLFESDNVEKTLNKLAVPGIIAMLISAIYNIVDSYFVGMLNSSEAMAAVAVAFPLFILISAVGQMFGVGAASYISRLLGKKDMEEANKTGSTTFFTAIVIALIFTVIGFVFMNKLLRIFGASDEIMVYALDYSRVLILGATFTILNMTLNNMIRAEGSPKYSMIAISLGAILNIVFDPIFMFAFDMGVKGAAIATVLGQGISTIFLISYYLKGKSTVKISLKNFTFNKRIYANVMQIGIATFARQALSSLSMGLINNAANPYGTAAVASVGITLRIMSIVMYVVFGYSQGFQPLAGYNYGAKKYKKLIRAIKYSLKVTTIFCTISSVLLIAFAPSVVGIFSSDPEVIKIGSMMLRYMCLFTSLFGFQNVYAVLFQALGKGKQALALSVARQGIFLIPAALILPDIFDITGVALIQPTADFLTIILTGVMAFQFRGYLKDKDEVSIEVA